MACRGRAGRRPRPPTTPCRDDPRVRRTATTACSGSIGERSHGDPGPLRDPRRRQTVGLGAQQNLNGGLGDCLHRDGRSRLEGRFPWFKRRLCVVGHMRIPNLKDCSYITLSEILAGEQRLCPTHPKRLHSSPARTRASALKSPDRSAALVPPSCWARATSWPAKKPPPGSPAKASPAISLPSTSTDHASVAAAAAAITGEFGRLDILVNNAGISEPADGPVPTACLDAVERILRTNFLGALAVTQAMLPLLRKAPAARIVNVSSGLGSLARRMAIPVTRPPPPSSSATALPAALNMLTVQLGYLLGDTPSRSIPPTRLYRHRPQRPPRSADHPARSSRSHPPGAVTR